MEGLGQHLRVGRHGSVLERDRGEAGDEHDAHRRVQSRGALGKLDSVQLGHDDIGQQQVETLLLEMFERDDAAFARRHGVTGTLQRAREIFAHRAIILGKKDTNHHSLRKAEGPTLLGQECCRN